MHICYKKDNLLNSDGNEMKNKWNLWRENIPQLVKSTQLAPQLRNSVLYFSQPGEKEIRNIYRSGGRAGFDTGIFPPIHISQFSFSCTEYFAPNFEGALPSFIHILAPLNKAVFSFYKKSHNTQLLQPSTIFSPNKCFADFQHIIFSQNLCPKLRCGPSCGYCCVKE